jgi:hypothetical protein
VNIEQQALGRETDKNSLKRLEKIKERTCRTTDPARRDASAVDQRTGCDQQHP